MNFTFSFTFSNVFELTSSYTEISHRRISYVSLIHMKIIKFMCILNRVYVSFTGEKNAFY